VEKLSTSAGRAGDHSVAVGVFDRQVFGFNIVNSTAANKYPGLINHHLKVLRAVSANIQC
jgi:hypothetical protein